MHLRERCGDESGICPRHIRKACLKLCEEGCVAVMETLTLCWKVLARLLVPYLHFLHRVVVLRVVVGYHRAQNQFCLGKNILPIDIQLMCAKSADAIRGVEVGWGRRGVGR